MESRSTIDASRLIDAQPISGAQKLVFFLAFLIAAFDGLDTQVIGYVLLDIAKEWNVTRATLGAVLSTGLFGIMIGALSLGTLGDMIGQKRVLVVLTGLIGLLTVLTGFSNSINQLYVLRFFTGLCVGGALPNTVALLSQYAPARRRAQLISIVGVGFPLGAATGGLLAALLLPEPGWRSVFYTAGSLAIMLCPILLVLLPDPFPAMLKRPNGQSAARTMLQRMYPQEVQSDATIIWSDASSNQKIPVAKLFSDGRLGLTLFVWCIFILSLMNAYLLPNWLPALLQDARLPTKEAALATSGFSIAGMVGAIFMGWLVDRIGFARTLVVTYLIGAGWIAVLSVSPPGFAVIATIVFLSGFFIIGSHGALNALPSLLYPADVRSTATGWALGIGRLGSIGGPALAGYLLSSGWTHSDVLLVSCAVAIGSALFLLALALWLRQSAKT